MMRIFRLGNSYIWVFVVFAALFVGIGMIGRNPRVAVLLMPITVGSMLICELQSGIALDSWWQAKYPKGTWQYAALTIWHAFVTTAFSAMAWYVWATFP